MSDTLLRVENLTVSFTSGLFGKQVLSAVDDVSFTVETGKTLAIVGESGCGKSTLAKAILRLVDASNGQVLFKGKDLLKLKGRELKQYRRFAQMVFQDPAASINPRMRVLEAIREPLRIHKIGSYFEQLQKVEDLAKAVGLSKHVLSRYPHEFSGGQKQRIGIARAIALNPSLLLADEPVSALDVSVQSQILNLLSDLRQQFHLTMLFISHDLGVVRHISDQVAVMYLGKIIELADSETFFSGPKHPYSKLLLDAVPKRGGKKAAKVQLTGDLPSPLNPPPGCRFHTRCPFAIERCKIEVPEFRDVGDRKVACHLV